MRRICLPFPGCCLGSGLAFCLVLGPESANFLPGFLARVPIFDLEHGNKFVELDFRLIDFGQIVICHQAPPRRGLASDQVPFFLEYRFVYHDGFLLIFIKHFNAPQCSAFQVWGLVLSFRDFV